ncbi:MAC/perforin domain-containing protein [Gramella sp. AN32]|uniref:MAC/perforin domain-containing protein n=1 Tax=Christiangramia antarctica TaxID=2058158 RepID=A0ABW5X9T4_9FLAO|nr:MAC/perforin domain-containing protein [Gramella sp. AN32]MCM4156503.1 hypothetical protein [Gramella sp. AN32]
MRKLFSIFLICITLYSCNKDEIRTKESETLINDTIVLRKRSSNNKIILSTKSKFLGNENNIKSEFTSDLLDVRYYLGRSYNISLGDIGTPDGIKFPVIEIEDLISDYPDYYLSKQIRNSVAKSYSFSSFNRYEEKTRHTDKISAGFEIDLGLFELGAKHKYESAFTSQVTNESKRVFGEVNVFIRDASYELLTSSNTLDKIKENYLNEVFLDEIYNTSNKEFVSNYGTFVITDFTSGGKAEALFTGVYNASSSVETIESSMDSSISASYSFEEIGASAEFGIGNENGSSIALSNNITEFNTSIRSFGGDYGSSSFTIPKNIDDVNVDLSQWASSLNDRSKTVLSDINDGGLIPISKFLIEDNFSHNLNNYLQGNFPLMDLQTPRLEARWVRHTNVSGPAVLVLKTRFGDLIRLSNYSQVFSYGDRDGMFAYATNEADLKYQFFDLNLVYIHFVSNDHNPWFNLSDRYKTSIADVDLSQMSKNYDNTNNMLYIFSEERKFAFSVHDDYILNTYGMTEWVENMNVKSISFNELKDYNVVAL